jgi:hypothetical protein
MKTKIEMKNQMAECVGRKKQITAERVEIKKVPFSQRAEEAHRQLMWLWSEARSAKEDIRLTQLAYAFVRGRRYWEVERHCRDGNAPSAYSIAYSCGAEKADVEAWLKAPVTDEEVAAYQAHLEAAETKRRATWTTRKARAA